jgi:hypothetical protein
MKTFSSMFVNERRRLKKLQERLSW